MENTIICQLPSINGSEVKNMTAPDLKQIHYSKYNLFTRIGLKIYIFCYFNTRLNERSNAKIQNYVTLKL